MKKEWRTFLTAVMFLTRLPVPKTVDHSADYLARAPRYFPLIGWIVGLFAGVAFLLFSRYISIDIGILASMITGILVTGAFHEDGFADVCDGLGGGWTREKILQIMKDSRIGAFGAIGLIAMLSSKFLLLKELAVYNFMLAALVAQTFSRLMPVLVMQAGVYAADPELSKTKPLAGPSISTKDLAVAIVLGLAPFALLPWHFLLVVPPALFAAYALYRYFRKWIGGYTGDCLGAIQQVTEIVIYLGFILIWRYL